MDISRLKMTAYFAHVCGLVAVLLGVLTLNGVIPYSIISQTEAVLGVIVGAGTIGLGRYALKLVDQLGR